MVKVQVSVRTLVEYVFLSGSIDNRFRTAAAMSEGTRIHQTVQAAYGGNDLKEVYVSAEIEYEHIRIVIDGRCDGVLMGGMGEEAGCGDSGAGDVGGDVDADADGDADTGDAEGDGLADDDKAKAGSFVIIDEIKSVSVPLEQMEENSYPVHWAQAIFYAYMYAKKHGLEQMGVQLTYVQSTQMTQKSYLRMMHAAELEQFTMETVHHYAPYLLMRVRCAELRDASIMQLAFPFSGYRNGQRQLIDSVSEAIADKQPLFACAPTGIGKTISTIYPAVQAIGQGQARRLFYLTARTTTRTAAEDALKLLQVKGLQLQTVTITAKDKICFKEQTICHKDYCEYADGYYDRINGAILDLLGNETVMDREMIEAYSRKHRVCPFEMSLDAAYAADAVIGDYNYIFDPRISLKRHREELKKHTVLLVDEAHNLVERGREMFSAELGKAAFLQLKRAFKAADRPLAQAASSVNGCFIALRKLCGERSALVLPAGGAAAGGMAAAVGGADTTGSAAGSIAAAVSGANASDDAAAGSIAAAVGGMDASDAAAGSMAAAAGGLAAGGVNASGSTAGSMAAAAGSMPSTTGSMPSAAGGMPSAAGSMPAPASATAADAAGLGSAQQLLKQLVPLLEQFTAAAEPALFSPLEAELQTLLLDAYYAAQHMLRIAALFDQHHTIYIEADKNDVRLKLFCLNPSHLLRQTYKNYRATIFFSATFTPLSYYRDMLGAEETDRQLTIASPFAREQLDVFIMPLSTRYRDRERTLQRLAGTLEQLVRKRPGNHLVFFPSYAYMNETFGLFQFKYPAVPTLVQQTGMTEEERTSFLAAFQADSTQTLVGFAVMGGIFSEGIDLVGDRLTGVTIVGVGLPQMGLERDILKEHFSAIGYNGFEYAYVIPGINKVQQAGGRLIRSEQDRGTLLLIDDRFLEQRYQTLLPQEWSHYREI